MKRRLFVFFCLACTIGVFSYAYKSYYSYLPTIYPIDGAELEINNLPTAANWLTDTDVLTVKGGKYHHGKVWLHRYNLITKASVEIPIVATALDRFVVSPDGKKILQWDEGKPHILRLFDMNGKQIGKDRKIDFPDASHAVWSPDSSKIYLHFFGMSYVRAVDMDFPNARPTTYQNQTVRYFWENGSTHSYEDFKDPIIDHDRQISAHYAEPVTPGVPHTEPGVPDGIEVQVHDLKTSKTSTNLLKLPIKTPYRVLAFKANNKDQILWLIKPVNTRSNPVTELWISDIHGASVRFVGQYMGQYSLHGDLFQSLDWLPNGRQVSVTELNNILVFNLK